MCTHTHTHTHTHAHTHNILNTQRTSHTHTHTHMHTHTRYRLSAGDGESSSEDDYYDRKEAELFKKTDSPASGTATSDPSKTISLPAKPEPTRKTESETSKPG